MPFVLFCDICDNLTPHIQESGDAFCKICMDAYPVEWAEAFKAPIPF